MAKFILTYRPANGYRPSEEAAAEWGAWFERIQGSVLDRGNPVFESSTLGNVAADTRLGGYSVVTAENLEAAVALAEGCPLLQRGGGVEVGVITELNPGA
jgi:YCII-related domain